MCRIKHNSKKKTDIKLCASSFSVVTLPVFSMLGQSFLPSCTEEDSTYLDRLCFCNEATFNVCGTVNRHNSCIWESENTNDVTEHE
jgi:hypothetical protein